MIDWKRVADLKREVGTDGFGEIVALFLDESCASLARLASSTDPASVAMECHFLRGSALSLGFVAFAAQCDEFEQSALAGQVEDGTAQSAGCCFDASRTAFLAGVSSMPD